MRKRLICMLLALMLIATAAACGGDRGGGGEIAPLETAPGASPGTSTTQPADGNGEAGANESDNDGGNNGSNDNGDVNGNGSNGINDANGNDNSSEPAGNGGSENSESTINGETPRRSQDVIDIFEGNNYSMLVELTAGDGAGGEFSMTLEMFVGGEDLQLVVVDMLGITLRTLIRDGYAYMLDDANKQYVRDMDDILGIMSGGLGTADDAIDNDMTYIGSGSDVFLGSMLDYDEFVNGEGDIVRLFFDNSGLAGISAPDNTDEWGDAVAMKVIRLASGVNPNVFEIPGDYTEVDILDLFGLGDFT